jgi:CoA:oxalate CoA-transferase
MTFAGEDSPPRRLPLEGVKILDLGQIYNGPYATVLLGLAGAEVVKVEPHRGDLLRGREGLTGGSIPFIMLNANKKSITLDLKTSEGRDLLIELAQNADVLVENFRPGVMDRLGVGQSVLRESNERLIYACSPGYGSTGPYRDYAAMDLTVQAMAGIMSITGFPDGPPVKAGAAVCDFLAGIHLYGAVTTALFQREVTGKGEYVEVAMFEAAFPSLMSGLGLQYALPENAPPVSRAGNRHAGNAEAPYDVYETANGYVAIICVNESHWTTLATLMGQPELGDDERFRTRRARVENIDELDDVISSWTAARSSQDLIDSMSLAGIPCAPVRDLSEVIHDPHLRARGLLQEIDHPDFGPVPVFSSPLRYGDDVEFPRTPTPSPQLGQHNREIYKAWAGLSDQEIDNLERKHVI